MSDLGVWITIIGLTAATLVTRAGMLVLGDRVRLPQGLERALRYAPVCALTGILVPDLAFVQGRLDLATDNLRLMATLASFVFFLVVRNMLATIVFGMLVFTALRLWS